MQREFSQRVIYRKNGGSLTEKGTYKKFHIRKICRRQRLEK